MIASTSVRTQLFIMDGVRIDGCGSRVRRGRGGGADAVRVGRLLGEEGETSLLHGRRRRSIGGGESHGGDGSVGGRSEGERRVGVAHSTVMDVTKP
jgi:hypothetical protein